MKTLKTSALFLFIISVSIALHCTSCQKQTETPYSNTITDGTKTAEHIREFRQRMQMHRNNPGLKSSIKYEANEAITELEDLINYDFGYGQGDCLGNTQNGLDAALLLESQLNQQITIVPPPGYVWRYQNVVSVWPIQPTDEGYLNSGDNTPADNYQDYLIFYADSEINMVNGLGNILTDDDKCVSTDASVGWNLEMAFYENSYNNIGNNIMIENEGNQWQINVIEYLGGMPGNQNYSAVKHDLSITSSFRYAVPEGDVAIDDIMAYE